MATIVCVDDDPGVLLMHKMLLENDGHTVLTASDGPTGLILCRQNRTALVVLDYRMPGMDGEQVTDELQCEQPKLPIVLCSGCPEEVPERLRALVSSLIQKGDGPGALLMSVRNLLARRARVRDHAKVAANQSTLTDWQNAVMLALTEPDPECRQRRIDSALHAIGRSVRLLSQDCGESQKRKAIAHAISSLAELSKNNKECG